MIQCPQRFQFFITNMLKAVFKTLMRSDWNEDPIWKLACLQMLHVFVFVHRNMLKIGLRSQLCKQYKWMRLWNFEMTMPQISTFSSQRCSKCSKTLAESEIRLNLKQCLRFPLFHHKHAQSAPKRLPEWNKTKFETMPQISTFSSQRCSKCLETLARVK